MLGILCGLETEARIARQVKNSAVACAAARPQKARDLARELIQKKITLLMSFGIAGGLEPNLPIGSLIIGTHVINASHNWECDRDHVNRLSRLLPEAHCGSVWGSETLVATAHEKAALYQRSQCMIVDMESQCAAEIAAEARIPLLVVRAVCDAVTMDVPPIVLSAIALDGSIAYGKAILHALRHPHEIPDLINVGKGTGKALRVLKAAVPVLHSI